ncbi:LysR family transcriptional regulator [Tranquillimonas alkanivorans]|uniref:Transcriptional regulator, LysR family n=1 Tax=Tranquillimonas alkanivorans TaxID=441119 RepID=A0A1I5T5V8_9RHOB|nr:LysR substrate-binding domain-containing protein [Tranquillimonas alkanivorans]SFP78348.1 transcriptional regulator, LysR family [Tranquillimonas alkanivorans]
MLKSTRLEIRHLRYALAVSDAGGFRAAADILNIAQPAISKAVKDTETDLGFRIFERSHAGLTLTDAGRVFLDDARLAVAQFERSIRASRRNAEGARGHVIVGYSALATSRQISDGLDAFHAAQPGVQVEMHVMSTDNMMQSLKSGTIDVGFLLSHPSAADPEVAQRPVWSSRIGAVVPRATGTVTLDDLRNARFVMGLRENWRSWRALLDSVCAEVELSPDVVDEAWDVQVIMQRVAEGRGVTLYPMSAAESLPGALEIRPVDGLAAEMTIAMAWGANADTALLRDFRRHFVPPGRAE